MIDAIITTPGGRTCLSQTSRPRGQNNNANKNDISIPNGDTKNHIFYHFLSLTSKSMWRHHCVITVDVVQQIMIPPAKDVLPWSSGS